VQDVLIAFGAGSTVPGVPLTAPVPAASAPARSRRPGRDFCGGSGLSGGLSARESTGYATEPGSTTTFSGPPHHGHHRHNRCYPVTQGHRPRQESLGPPAVAPCRVRTRLAVAHAQADAGRRGRRWLMRLYNADVIDALVEHGQVTAMSRVVDVGTGTGFVAAGLAGQAATVTGIDNSPAMLAVAAGNLAALDVENVRLAAGELDNLPLPDDSVDVAVANIVLHHAPDPARMLAEMARVVRPGGTIAITDEVEHPYEWMRTEQADIWLGFTPEQIQAYFQ